MPDARSYYQTRCLPDPTTPENKNLFAGIRDRVRIAVAAFPSKISYESAMKQREKFRAIRTTKSPTT